MPWVQSHLMQARALFLGSSEGPSLLLVARPSPSLPTVDADIQVVWALNIEATSLISEAATVTMVIDAFRHHRYVHFACYGTLEAGKPFLSACHTAEVTEGSIADEDYT